MVGASGKYSLEKTDYGKWALIFESETDPEYWLMDDGQIKDFARRVREVEALLTEGGF